MAMKNDPRIRVAYRGLALSWSFFTIFLATDLTTAALAGDEPRLFGLPRWVALACIVVPAAFVAVLVPLVEKSIPDVPLSDGTDGEP